MRFYSIQLVVLILLTAGIAPCRAETTLSLKNQSKALLAAEKELEQETSQKEEITQKMREIETELMETKDKLVSTAGLIRENERNLQDIESRIQNLEDKKAGMETRLTQDRAGIARMIIALERIRRTPPEAMLARPEPPFETAQAALLMGELIPSIERHTAALQKNLETLAEVSTELTTEKDKYVSLSQSLKKQYETLSILIETREEIYRQTNEDIQTREENIQKISHQAQNLEDLVSRLKEEENAARKRMMQKNELASLAEKENDLPSPVALKFKETVLKERGKAQLPVAGLIKVQYHQKDDLGADSNGLTIEGRSEGLVVAPLGGIIQFAGTFKKYGNIVIIEHENGFHSLVAGLEKIDTLVGEHVESGEPIGTLPKSPTPETQPRLYYELRQNGKPVNPSVKFADLG